MSSLRAKILQTFKNLKSDAVPRPPRADGADDEEAPGSEIPEEVKTENLKKDKKKNGFLNGKKKKSNSFSNNDPENNPAEAIVNSQVAGNVINIVNSRDFHWGNEFVYNIGVPNQMDKEGADFENEHIEKDNLIMLLMEDNRKPEHAYIDYISKNLGKNWHSFFRALGFTKGRIETMEIDEARNGVSEARYKLLLDWIRNDDDGTLGRLAALLWEEGERQIVKDLSLIYKNRTGT